MAQTSACKWRASRRFCAWPGDRTIGAPMILMRRESWPSPLATGSLPALQRTSLTCSLNLASMPSMPPRHLDAPCLMLTEWRAAQLSARVLTVQVIKLFNVTARNFPDAEIQVSTLDAYFELLVAQAPKLKLPVVTGEIGDSWIYGEPSHGIGMRTARRHPCCGGKPSERASAECCIFRPGVSQSRLLVMLKLGARMLCAAV